MDSHDLLKARADERERNFYSLRTVEWTVVFQSYAGFAVVAAVYHQLQASQGWWLGVAATTALSLLLLTSIYLSFRIQERLRVNRDIQNHIYDELHRRLKVERFDVEENGPLHGRWYALGSHLFVSLAIYSAILLYVLSTTPHAGVVALLTAVLVAGFTIFGICRGWLRMHHGAVTRTGPPDEAHK